MCLIDDEHPKRLAFRPGGQIRRPLNVPQRRSGQIAAADRLDEEVIRKRPGNQPRQRGLAGPAAIVSGALDPERAALEPWPLDEAARRLHGSLLADQVAPLPGPILLV